ncbi:MAG: hypothetical protein V1672_05825 [Candidatus Diapherotrites archaeon]
MRLTALLIMLALLISSVSAMELKTYVPNPVYIFDSPKEITFVVENRSSVSKELQINFATSADYDISNYPSELRPHESRKVSMTIYPEKGFEGSVFESQLIINLGNETQVTNMIIKFRGTENSEEAVGEIALASGFFTLFGAASNAGLSEIVFNVVLVVIAAILLIAFISRYTKRITK